MEIDKVWFSIIAYDHVLALFEVDVGHLPLMNESDILFQRREEVVWYVLSLLEGMAIYVLVDEAMFAETSEESRDYSEILQFAVRSRLMVSMPSSNPSERQKEYRCLAAHLEDDTILGARIEGGRGKEVMLEYSFETVHLSFDGQLLWQGLFAQGTQEGWSMFFWHGLRF